MFTTGHFLDFLCVYVDVYMPLLWKLKCDPNMDIVVLNTQRTAGLFLFYVNLFWIETQISFFCLFVFFYHEHLHNHFTVSIWIEFYCKEPQMWNTEVIFSTKY